MPLTRQDKDEISKLIDKELKSFLDSTKAHKLVIDMVKKEFGKKTFNEYMINMATKVVVELFRTLWQRKSFWEGDIKNVR